MRYGLEVDDRRSKCFLVDAGCGGMIVRMIIALTAVYLWRSVLLTRVASAFYAADRAMVEDRSGGPTCRTCDTVSKILDH